MRPRDGPGVEPDRDHRPGAAGLPGRIGRRRRGPGPHADARRRPAASRDARRGVLARALGHPYVRLAQNGSFGALWMGQLISLFGDRLHQLALVALVGEATQNGAFAVAMVFVAATVPNLVFGPAGRRPRRPLGPEARDDRLGPPAGRDRARDPRGRDRRRPPRLPARLRPHDRLDLLPARADRGDPANRQGRRAGGRQLGHLAGRLARRRPGLPAGGALRRLPRQLARRSRSGWMP